MGLHSQRRHRWVKGLVLGTIAVGVVSAARAWADEAEEASAPLSTLKEIFKSWVPGLDQGAGGTPESMTEDSEISPADFLSEDDHKNSLNWQAPDYTNQKAALGWSETAFDVPEAMKLRVAFWKDIYSKYTTDQGVLHDSLNVHIIYESVDFGSITKNSSLSSREKHRARERLVNDRRKALTERLQALHEISRQASQSSEPPADLSQEDLRLWKLLESIQDPNRFKNASEKGRIRFQLGQKDKFLLGIYYSGLYLQEMEKIFRTEGVPVELTRLPFVESSFNIKARSRVGASGIWQFMPRTGRAYMKVGRDVDERNDPLRSTRAAARVFKENYSMLQAWPLAVTGYNHGAYGVRRISQKLKTQDLTEIISRYRSSSFGFASENFYACFLAAIEVEKNADKFFADPRWSPRVEMAEVRTSRTMTFADLVRFFDGKSEETTLFNPHFLQPVRIGRSSIPRGTFIRVPAPRKELAEKLMSGAISSKQLIAELGSNQLPKVKGANPAP